MTGVDCIMTISGDKACLSFPGVMLVVELAGERMGIITLSTSQQSFPFYWEVDMRSLNRDETTLEQAMEALGSVFRRACDHVRVLTGVDLTPDAIEYAFSQLKAAAIRNNSWRQGWRKEVDK